MERGRGKKATRGRGKKATRGRGKKMTRGRGKKVTRGRGCPTTVLTPSDNRLVGLDLVLGVAC